MLHIRIMKLKSTSIDPRTGSERHGVAGTPSLISLLIGCQAVTHWSSGDLCASLFQCAANWYIMSGAALRGKTMLLRDYRLSSGGAVMLNGRQCVCQQLDLHFYPLVTTTQRRYDLAVPLFRLWL